MPFPIIHYQHLRSQLPDISPLLTAVLQSAIIACISNTVAQSIRSHRDSTSFTGTFSFVTLLQFVALDLLTAPPNFKWQEFLERSFPARPFSFKERKERRSYEAVPLAERDVEEGMKEDDDGDEGSILEDQGIGRSQQQQQQPQRPNQPQRQHPQRHQPPNRPKSKLNWRNTFAKWFIDCITVGAMGNTLAFLIIMGVLKGQAPSKIGYNIRHETLTIVWNGYKIWPIANFIAHAFVPWEKKIVWFAFVGLCWNVYLSLVAMRI